MLEKFLEALNNIANAINRYADIVDKTALTATAKAGSQKGAATAAKPAKKEKKAEGGEAPVYSNVRAIAQKASGMELKDDVKAILSSEAFGVTKLTDLADTQFPAFIKEVQALIDKAEAKDNDDF